MPVTVSTAPPNEAQTLHVWVLDDETQLPNLKRSLLDVVVRQRPSEKFTLGSVADKIILIATELATSALRNGLPPTIVRLLRNGPCLIVDIADHDTQVPAEFADAQPPGAGGLGLRLAKSLDLTVNWYVTDSTKNVWVEFLPEGAGDTSPRHTGLLTKALGKLRHPPNSDAG